MEHRAHHARGGPAVMSRPRPSIPAIETRAFGHHFRSRTEARFATFCETAGIPWEYEPEGYRTEGGSYLPDFRIRTDWAADQVWVEIKPPTDTFDDPRWASLARGSGVIFLVLRGLHRRSDRCGTDHTVRAWHPDGLVADVHRLWTGPRFAPAWDAASTARFDSRRPAGRKGRRT
jgi:hypothetical protein